MVAPSSDQRSPRRLPSLPVDMEELVEVELRLLLDLHDVAAPIRRRHIHGRAAPELLHQRQRMPRRSIPHQGKRAHSLPPSSQILLLPGLRGDAAGEDLGFGESDLEEHVACGEEEEMASAAVACRRALLLHGHQQWPQRLEAAAPCPRTISQLVKTNGCCAFLVDTLALLRKLESQGVPTKQAEVITSAITVVLNDSLESISESFVSKVEMQKSEMLQESNISKFKSQVQSSQM